MIPGPARTAQPPRLAGWGEWFTCYTAALANWLSERVPRWWRPLLAGGPYLRLEAVGDSWRFDHAPQPLAETLGLSMHTCDDSGEFCARVLADLETEPAVIVTGDVYRLPWQRGFARWHAPHWFVLRQDAGGLLADDCLAMTTPAGEQAACRVPLTWQDVTEIGVALAPWEAIFELRERSVLGAAAAGLNARYRWLSTAGAAVPGTAPATAGHREQGRSPVSGPAACLAIAGQVRAHGSDPAVYAWVDEVWQAARHRELLVAAAEVDPDLLTPAGRAHWLTAVAQWRTVPRLLLHARMRAEAGSPQPAEGAIAALERLSRYEGSHLVPAALGAEELGRG